MPVVAKGYSKGVKNLLNGTIDFDTDAGIKIALLNAHTPNQNTHEFFSDVVANQITGTGYTARGQALANKSVSVASNVVKLDADDPTWANSTITATHAVVYKDTGVDGTSPLISYIDFGGSQVSSSGEFKITLDALGLLSITVN